MGRFAVKDKLMATFIAAREQVKVLLQGSKVALTSDHLVPWTSPNKMAFIGTTVALLDKKFQPTVAIIGFQQMLGEHSGYNITQSFYETIHLFDLREKVHICNVDILYYE